MILLVHSVFYLFVYVFPKHTEQNPLHAVGEDFGLEASAEKSQDTIGFDDVLGGLYVADLLRVGLTVDFDHPETVGDGVGSHSGAEADTCIS